MASPSPEPAGLTRRAGAGVRSLAEKIAEAGHRVIAYDRRNTGASGVAIEGESENDEWAEDLHELLGRLDALPAYIGGSSSGCRLAMILALRRPEVLLDLRRFQDLFRVLIHLSVARKIRLHNLIQRHYHQKHHLDFQRRFGYGRTDLFLYAQIYCACYRVIRPATVF